MAFLNMFFSMLLRQTHRNSCHLRLQSNFEHDCFIKFARVCDVDQEVDGKEVKMSQICAREKVLLVARQTLYLQIGYDL